MSLENASKTARPQSAAKRSQKNAMRIGASLSALVLIILGSTNLALNGMAFFKGGPNNLWLVSLPFIFLFAVAPILFGIWMLNRAIGK